MITNVKKRGLRFVALTAAALVAAAGFTAGSANAAGNIDTNQHGSITIHKFETPAGGAGENGGNGTEASKPTNATPLAGVTFSLHKVNGIDLKKAADWNKVKKLTFDGQAVKGVDNVTLGDKVSDQKTAEGTGIAKFSDLEIGVYLVQEIDAPSKVSKKASPFFVTVPYPTPENNPTLEGARDGWIYDVHVFPKNDTSEVSKTVGENTATTSVGTDIEWVINATVPNGEDLTGFRVHDRLDEKVKFNATKTPVLTLGDDALVVNDDYQIVDPGTAGGKVQFNFTAAGLQKLNAGKGKKVTVKFFTTVVKELADNVVPNDGATVGFNHNPDAGGEWTEIPPVTNPKAYFGNYTIKKVSTNDAKLLKGAKFGIYATREDATAGDNVIKEVTSTEAGIVAFTGLYRGSEETSTKAYYIKEIEAPAGFKLSDTVTEVQITKDSGKQAEDTTIENTPFSPNDVPDLPLTGASGQLLLTIIGVAVIFAAVGTLLFTRSKKTTK